jgi:hypothetical protein
MRFFIFSFFAFISLFAKSQTELYDPSVVQVIEITFSQTNWDYQMDTAKAGSEGYILADMVVINGVSFPNSGVKYKGNSTYNASNDKNPLHIKLDYTVNQDYDGYEDLKLSNGSKDPSMVREVLAYDILQNYMHCPRSNYARVYINGTYYGVFSNSESISKSFCSDHFYSSGNAFFKCNPIGGAGPGSSSYPDLAYYGTTQSSYTSRYEMQSDFGWDDLIHLTDTLKNFTGSIEEILDVDRALWMLAFNDVFVNLDSYTGGFRQNYYLYRDNNGRFNSIIWDLNMCFGSFTQLGATSGGGGGLSVTAMETMTLYPHQTETGWPLIYYIFQNDTYKKMYLAHVRTLATEMIDSGYLATRAQELHDIVATAVAEDNNYIYTVAQFNSNLNSTVTVTGGGMGGGSIAGVTSIMNNRLSFLESNSDYNLDGPAITNVLANPTAPFFGDDFAITADVDNATEVYLGYRPYIELNFTKVTMYDDGAHNDGAANDGTYGAFINASSGMIQYYIYAQNAQAGMFSPVRAEHEFYSINISVPVLSVGDVVINEFVASNETGATDADGQYDDWIEFYNTTDSDISLSGTYLSDNFTNPTKWAFPENAVVPANGYLTIWADENGGQVGVHTNFKLSALGEELVFGYSDGTILDTHVYGAQFADRSVARCENGSGPFIDNVLPTFGAFNECIVGVDEEQEFSSFEVYPNPATDFIQIDGTSSIEYIHILSSTGQLVTTIFINNYASIRFEISDLANGIYLLQTNTGETRRIVVGSR